ncbi:ATP-binding protein [Micromonospora sp. NPDC048898]|uniref:ATP-binding protein n=1 Tax=Micromonospora sp. NPDC048898 TaxID=3364260 RepID=UPI0037198627
MEPDLYGSPPAPEGTATPMEFVGALRQLRLWSGLTYRQLAAKAAASGDALPFGTIASVLSRTSLPRREFVVTFTRACGLDEASIARWVRERNALAVNATQVVGGGARDDGADLATAEPAWPSPAMLPPDIADFTGRAAEVAALTHRLTDERNDGRAPTALPVTTIAGMGGVGKTALATHVAHLVRAAYPDGQLWANLTNADASPVDPAEVLARFLRALGMPYRAIPACPAERAEAYRTRTANRRVLVVLDNAVSEGQVRPLLPGAAPCAVLITSRARMTAIEGSRRIDLDVLSATEAVEFLVRLADDERVVGEPTAAADLVKLCGYLPLAVRIAGARLAARPTWQLAHLVEQLDDEQRRLDWLVTGDLTVRASLAISYRGLTPEAQRLFRLLGLFDVPDFSATLAAAVLGCPPERAIEHTEALVDAQLLVVDGLDVAGQTRYRFHDLTRLFAARCAELEVEPDERAQAVQRGLGGWLALARRMARWIPGPCYAPISGRAPHTALDWADDYAERVAAADWFDAECAALQAGVRQACRLGLDDLAFDLAGCLEKYFDLRGRYTEWTSLNTEAMAVCRVAGNRLGEAVMLRGLLDVTTWITDDRDGDAMARSSIQARNLLEMFTALGHDAGASDAAVMYSWALSAGGAYPEATAMATRALSLAERSDHLGGQARSNLALAMAYYEQQHVDLAIGHALAALENARALGNMRWVATGLQYLGIAYRQLGDHVTSERMLDESLAISRAHRDHYPEVLTVLALARLYLERGDGTARETAETALTLSRRYHMRHHLAEAYAVLGEIELRDGRPAHAIRHLEASVAIWRTRGWHSFQAASLTTLGKAYLHVDAHAAHQAFVDAQALYAQLGNTDKVAELGLLADSAADPAEHRERQPRPS